MDKVYDYLLNDLNLKYGDTVVVGVSGGPDSMALLSLLVKLKKALELNIICAHVNHNMRKESEEERDFVSKYCKKNSILFEYMKIEEYGDDNFHNEARNIRYNFFETLIKKYNAKYLFTAHHGDDLIETILMRIVRGSTLKGYSGFSKVVFKEKYQIIRPLIEVTKDEILDYCKKNKIEYRIDQSNFKEVYTRNRFRKNIVPVLKKEDKKVNEKFYKFSQTLLEYNEFIDLKVRESLKEVYVQNVLNIEMYLKLDSLIQKKIIYYLLESIYQDDLMLITDHHANIIYDLIISKKANASICLPNQIKVIKAYETLTFISDFEDHLSYEIEIDKYTNLPNGKNIETVLETDLKDNSVTFLNSDDITLPLIVRTRKNGDKMDILGMLGRKKINDIFIDSKIASDKRNLWPVVTDSKGVIVWLPGLKKSKFDKTKNGKYDIILKYY